jgi:hypothetical protein
LKTVAYFSSKNLWRFQPHFHHDLHHVYHAKTPRYATTFPQKPLQNTTATTPEKNPGMVANFFGKYLSCRTGSLRGRRSLRDLCTGLGGFAVWALPLVGMEDGLEEA